jgi:hypothetical protein
MHALPQRLPLVQCGPLALLVVVVVVLVFVLADRVAMPPPAVGVDVVAVAEPEHIDFLAILPLESWQWPFASSV